MPGIPYCIREIAKLKDAHLYAAKMEKFFNYFERTWIGYFEPVYWNITAAFPGQDLEDVVVNRTNNPLENFNKQLKKAMGGTNPSMVKFVQIIVGISIDKVRYLAAIRNGSSKPKHHPSVHITTIPADYSSFIPPVQVKVRAKKSKKAKKA